MCTNKLKYLIEGLLDALLSMDTVFEISLETCQKLFQSICISQGSRIQFLTATLLVRACGKEPFWGAFLANTLKEMYSSSYTNIFPQDRVFVLLAFLGRKSAERGSVLDATLKVISDTLSPLARGCQSLLAVNIDLPLLGWLLLFLSLQLDMVKSSPNNTSRWDWVTGEMAGKNVEQLGSNFKKKLHKKVQQYKQQLETLEWTPKVLHNTSVQVCH